MVRPVRYFAYAFAFLLAAPLAAQAAVLTHPGPTQSGPTPATTVNSTTITSPGDPFEPERPRRAGSDITPSYLPDRPHRPLTGFHETLGLKCVTSWWQGKNKNEVLVSNISGSVIPKGTVVTFTIKPSGQTYTFTFGFDVPPDAQWWMHFLTGVDADQIECVVTVNDKVLPEKPAGDKVP